MLVPLYTHVLETQADYGIVTHLYAWTALLLVILTYGMETGYFRFTNREDENPTAVYSTALIALFTTSLIFAISCVVLRYPIAAWLGYAGHEEFIALMGVVVAIDAFASIPFAYLRYKKRPIKFASVKLVFVFLNIVFNLFFLVVCPYIAHWSCVRLRTITTHAAVFVAPLGAGCMRHYESDLGSYYLPLFAPGYPQ